MQATQAFHMENIFRIKAIAYKHILQARLNIRRM